MDVVRVDSLAEIENGNGINIASVRERMAEIEMVTSCAILHTT